MILSWEPITHNDCLPRLTNYVVIARGAPFAHNFSQRNLEAGFKSWQLLQKLSIPFFSIPGFKTFSSNLLSETYLPRSALKLKDE